MKRCLSFSWRRGVPGLKLTPNETFTRMCLQSSEVHGSERRADLLHAEQGLQLAPEDTLLLVLAEALEPLHPSHGRGVPRNEGPVAAQHHAVGAHLIEQEPEVLFAARHGVVVEATLIRAGRLRDAAGLGTALPPAIKPAHREACGAAAVGDAHPEIRTRLQDAAGDQDGHDDGVVEDDAEAVEEPVARGALHQEVVLRLRMEKEDGAHGLGGLEERQELRLVPLLTVHVRVELGALEAEHGDGALQLIDGRFDVLHGQGGEAGEALRRLAGQTRDLVVNLAGELAALRGIEMVTEERGVDRDHLYVHALRVHVLQALCRGEAHLGRAESRALAVAHHDTEAFAGLVPVPVPFLARVGGPPEGLRHEVGVNVDGAHAKWLGGGLRPPSEASPRRSASRRASRGWGPAVRGEQSENCAGEAGARSGTLLLARAW